MVVAATKEYEELFLRGFFKSSAGFFVPYFGKINPDKKQPEYASRLRDKGFKERQIKYIVSVLDKEELDVISDHLEDALAVAIVNSMPDTVLNRFYHFYRASNPGEYMHAQNEWLIKCNDLTARNLGRRPNSVELMMQIETYVKKRFRAYWRIRHPEKTEVMKWAPLRKN